MIDGGRSDLVANGQDGDAGFESAGAAEQVPGHRLRGTHRDLVGVVAEGALDRQRLGPVATSVEVPCALM